MPNRTLSKPAQGAATVPIEPGQPLAFDFDHFNALFDRADDDLVLTFDDGSTLTLDGFFATGEGGELPPLQLADGTVVSAAEFLLGQSPELDISTAMGSLNAAASGSGLGGYLDGSGDLVAGVERLGAVTVQASAASAARGAVIPGISGVVAGDGTRKASGVGPAEPGTPGEDVTGPETPGLPPSPSSYVKAALLGADGTDSPAVSVSLLDAGGNALAAPYPDNVSISGSEFYTASYDRQTGAITFTLKNPENGAAPAENITVVVNGQSYIVQVGSSASNDLAGVEWISAGEGVSFTDKTWAGSASDHLDGGDRFVAGHTTGATIATPDGYADTELHLQMRDSSVISRTDTGVPGAENASVDLNLKNGSFTISNENHAVFDVHHADPVDTAEYWYNPGGYVPTTTEYDASVVAALASKGDGARTTVTVNGGEAVITAGGGAPETGGHGAVNISGIYAAEGGKVVVEADTITAGASSDGFARDGKTAVVTGVRADGAVREEVVISSWTWNGETYYQTEMQPTGHSEAILRADGDIDVSVAVTGDADGQDHSGMSYAAVAATENGQVTLEAGGDVSLSAANRTNGQGLETAGMYGIYSGYGLGANDLPGLAQFPATGGEDEWGDFNGDGLNEYNYDYYASAIAQQYANDKRGEWNDETRSYDLQGDQTLVAVKAAGNVDVALDLGDADYNGEASGIKVMAGDVDIRAGGDITVDVRHAGTHGGDSEHALSALEIGNGTVGMHAGGDITLSLSGNGDNLSVVNYHPFSKAAHDYGLEATHLSGRNVTLKGEAGANGAADNSITGIDANGANFKKEAFTVHADEKFTIDVTARHNGGTSSSTGIGIGESDGYYNYYRHDLSVAVDAPEFEIRAAVTGDVSQGDSKAAGIAVGSGSSLGIMSYDSLDEFKDTGYPLEWGRVAKPVESLSITARGARHNAGIEVSSLGNEYEDRARADIRAEELTISASGGVASGASSSYGLLARNTGGGRYGESALINIETGHMTVTVDNPQNSVGLAAHGPGSSVSVGSVREYEEGGWREISSPITVIINCTITNGEEQLRGIAIEALNGGQVTIASNQYDASQPAHADTILINGDIVARSEPDADGYYRDQSRITFDTGYGDDRVVVNGDVSLGKSSAFTVNLGDGNDFFSLGGGITLDKDGSMYLDAGAGDDLLMLNGKVDPGYYQEDGNTYVRGSLYITGGEGNDVLVLQAPDAATFNAWYKDWLQRAGILDELQCESIVVQGVDDPDSIAWLAEMIRAHGDINFQVAGSGVDLSGVTDLASLSAILGDLAEAETLDGLLGPSENSGASAAPHPLSADGPVTGMEALSPENSSSPASHNADLSACDVADQDQLYMQLISTTG